MITVSELRNEFLLWAEKHGWKVLPADVPQRIPEQIAELYHPPAEWLDFIGMFQSCTNAEETKWFLTCQDFHPHDEGFAWNDFALQSLASAGTDKELIQYITSFWNAHLPIFMSADGEYTYYAIHIPTGNIVSGTEPEFEEISIIAENFTSLIQKILSGEIIL